MAMNDGQQDLPLPGPRISRIGIGRLHNLGNYEHVRYEVTVELPPGTSPARPAALIAMQTVAMV